MQKILVTGGAGFIGSHLCKSLLDNGYFVICLDNLLTGSKKNIENLFTNPNFEFIKADVCSHLNLNLDLNFIFHLASPASPIDYQNFSEETLLVNSKGTLNVLNLANQTKAKVLIASTSEIYGDPLEHPQKETYWGNANSFGPRSCYDESKRFTETASYVFYHKYNLDVRIVRIFNTYGPNMQKDDGRVVSNFINWAIENKSIKIDGDGSQTRSFCYVSDLVDGIMKIMFDKKTKGEIFNLGNPNEFKIKELADIIIKLTNSKSKIILSKSFRPDDPMQRCPDITKIKKMLNWKPEVELIEGLTKTIKYYQSI